MGIAEERTLLREARVLKSVDQGGACGSGAITVGVNRAISMLSVKGFVH